MILQKMTLKNFRQFEGEQSVLFSTDPQHNVTVFHGFNGSGKTALLNAFTWVLYGEVSPDFEFPDRLDSEPAFSQLEPGQAMTTEIRLTFQDRGREYVVERSLRIKKDANGSRLPPGPADLRLTYTDEQGEMQEPSNPQDALEQLLPKRLYPFFFFNGERIERLARPDAYEQIEDGVKTLLGLELLERAITHLDRNISRTLREEIAEHSGDEGQRAQQERNELDVQRQQVADELDQAQQNFAAQESRREAIDEKLRQIPAAARLQGQRDEAIKREESLRSQLGEVKTDLCSEFSRSGYLALCEEVPTSAKQILDGAREKGELPPPIKRQFVRDRLHMGRCICNRPLEPGTEEYRHVEGWLQQGFSDKLSQSASELTPQLTTLEKRREESLATLDTLQSRRSKLSQELERVREELSELSRKIGNQELGEDPTQLEQERTRIESQLSDLKFDCHSKKQQLDALDSRIREKDREIQKLERADEQGKIAQRRLDAVSNVKAALEQIRVLRHADLRDDLSAKLREVWARISVKDYEAQLGEGFRLHLTKRVGGEEQPVRGASTGEKQILSLGFVGALAAKARETGDQDGAAGGLFQGGKYPIVIDSAFGNLEEEYRREVGQWIPKLAPQVVLFVSKTQWRREIEEEITPRIGAEWVLKLETTKDKPSDIVIRGRTYPYVVQASDCDRTTFVEVDL